MFFHSNTEETAAKMVGVSEIRRSQSGYLVWDTKNTFGLRFFDDLIKKNFENSISKM